MSTDSLENLYAERDNGTAWFVGIIVALALLAIGYLVLSANNSVAYAPLTSPHVKVVTAKGHGSATHIGDGLFVTAAHVVTDQPSATVDGEQVEILWVNRQYDIALLRGPSAHATMPMSCTVPSVGTQALAYGNPGNLESISTSIRVAGAARQLDMWKVAVPVDGALAPGMSGGGAIAGGQLVGVIVGVAIVPLGFTPSLYGVGFIVPSSVVCDLLGRT